jgi:CheY-like chemotaxis protein
MPDRDGYELIAQLRAAEGNVNQRIPAFAATAFARDEDRARAINAGFQGHVVKPFDFSILLSTVARALRSE